MTIITVNSEGVSPDVPKDKNTLFTGIPDGDGFKLIVFDDYDEYQRFNTALNEKHIDAMNILINQYTAK